ncbi:MAG: alpha/beta hydrolase [Acidiferrobacterales bacterium]|nr:alpha/beta hydrolase [Acidiferrobacterales bacterium]
MFEHFESFDIDCDGVNVHGVVGGEGPPVLLLHGYPQTHAMWHKVAPDLARHYRVIAADLRGYGRSGKPDTDSDHSPYSKRAMASDLIELMQQLGFEQFRVVAHDRGGRVAHRMAMDWPDKVIEMILLDIAPTREMYQLADTEFARAYWHWYFLITPAPFPEKLIEGDPEHYWLSKCGSGAAGLTPFSPMALEDYLRCFADPAVIHASCEDYRAAISIDIQHDDADGDRKIECPLRVIWGEHGVIEQCFDALALWRLRANDVSGFSLPGGHYLAEELPQAVFQSVREFFTE